MPTFPINPRLARTVLLLPCLLLPLACHTATPVTTPRVGDVAVTSASPVSAASAATPEGPGSRDMPTAAPAGTSPSPAAALAPQRLLAPAGASRQVTGQVTVDALSVASRGAIALSANGQSLVSPAGGTIISNNGGSLISSAGSLLALADGNMIPDSHSGVNASQGGQALVSSDNRLVAAGSVIANNGGGVISDNGGGIISNHGGGYQLAALRQVLATGNTSAEPVAGVLVSAISLTTHAYLPVGVDAQGKSVYSVFTDLAGGYHLYLPDTEAGTVLIAIGSAPNAEANVRFNAIATANAQTSVATNEDTDLAAYAMREAFVDSIALILTSQDAAATLAKDLGTVAAEGQVFVAFDTKLNGEAQAAGVPQGADAARIPAVRQLAYAVCDAILGATNTSEVQLSPAFGVSWQGSPETASQALDATAHAARLQAERYIASLPAGTAPIVTYVVDGREKGQDTLPFCPEHVTVPLQTPSDLFAYAIGLVVENKYIHGTTNLGRSFTALSVPGLPATTFDHAETLSDPVFNQPGNPDFYTDAVNGQQLRYSERAQAALTAVTGSIGLSLWQDPDGTGGSGVAQAVATAVTQFAASHVFTGSPAPVPTPSYQTTVCTQVSELAATTTAKP